MPDYSHLLQQSVEAPLATQMEPVPEGEYLARIEDLDLGVAEWNDKNSGEPRSAPRLTLTWDVIDEGLKANLGREKITVRQQFLLDVTPSGQLDTGKDRNVRLGRVAEAVGLNGVGFQLPQLKGSAPALIRVRHRADRDDPEIKYPEVATVAKAR